MSPFAFTWLLAKWSASGRSTGLQGLAFSLLEEAIDCSCEDISIEIAFDERATDTASIAFSDGSHHDRSCDSDLGAPPKKASQ
eukprot:10028635-Alexandrium_andersonii.AAC.1